MTARIGAEVCPKGVCDGSGWILEEEANTAHPCPCRQLRINRARSRDMGTGIPKRFREASFDRNPVRELDPVLLRDVRRFCDEIDHNLAAGRGRWFFGDVGTGKTLLAMLIAKAADRAGRSIAVYSVPHLLAAIKETYEEDSSSSYMKLFRRLAEVDLLVLDDLGAERRTEWVLEQLYSIVNERWQDERSIVVTANLSPAGDQDGPTPRGPVPGGPAPPDRWSTPQDPSLPGDLGGQRDLVATHLRELREQVGRRTVSRLIEICGDPIPIMGPDLRIAGAP